MLKEALATNNSQSIGDLLSEKLEKAIETRRENRRLILFVKSHGRFPDIIRSEVSKKLLKNIKELLKYLYANKYIKTTGMDSVQFSYPWYDKNLIDKINQDMYINIFIDQCELNTQIRLALDTLVEKNYLKLNKYSVEKVLNTLKNSSCKRYFLRLVALRINGRKLKELGMIYTFFEKVSPPSRGGFDSDHQRCFLISLKTNDRTEGVINSEILIDLYKKRLIHPITLNSFCVAFKHTVFSDETENLHLITDLLNGVLEEKVSSSYFRNKIKENLFKSKLMNEKEKKILNLIL